MRRTVARIGLVAVLALSVSVAAATAPPASADDNVGLVSSARSDAGLMNYAINLDPNVGESEMASAADLIPSVGGVLLTSYPQLGTLFAQSESASFAPDLADALAKAGVSVHSIGPTRVAAVPESERAVGGARPAAPAADPAAAPAADGPVADVPAADAPDVPTVTIPDPNSRVGSARSNWGAEAMDARGAAEVAVTRAPVAVGIIDTGIDDTQPDLVGRVDTARSVSCAVNGVPNEAEDARRFSREHGTHVAGVIAANHNDIGIDGIAPEATLVSIKALNESDLLYPEALVCAYEWATTHQVDIVHNSYQMDPWVYWNPTDPEQAAALEAAERAIHRAQSSGLAVIAGAGDRGVDIDHPTTDSDSPTDSTPIPNRSVEGGRMVPAQVSGVVTVSSVGMEDWNAEPLRATLMRAERSNYGASVDFAAPGEWIYSTYPNGRIPQIYGYTSGTSTAAAHVSGIAALVKSVHPTLPGAQIIRIMRKQAAYEYGRLKAPSDGAEYRGYGFLDARSAMVRDQASPVIRAVEYREGEGDWTSLSGAVLPAEVVQMRVEASAPVSYMNLDIAGVTSVSTDREDGYFAEPMLLEADEMDLRQVIPDGQEYASLTAVVFAEGLNYDRHADDDATTETTFTVARDPNAVPAPQPAPDPGDDPAPGEPVAPGIISPDLPTHQLPANYAVNLTAGADEATVQRAAAKASSLGALVLAQYPAFGTFFVQSGSPSFASDLGAVLSEAGISFHSVGPTRQAPVLGNEAVMPVGAEGTPVPGAADEAGAGPGADSPVIVGGLYPPPPSDNQWHLKAIGALDAQGVDVMRAPVTVGVMADGFDHMITDLDGRVDFDKSVSCNVNGIPTGSSWMWGSSSATRGTQMASVVAGRGVSSGVPGVNPTLSVAAIDVQSRQTGMHYPEYVVCGFVWAADHGISVTASSFAADPWKYWMPHEPNQAAGREAMRRAIDYAASKDVINVVDAGNGGIDLDNPPIKDSSSPTDAWAPYERDSWSGLTIPTMMDNVVPVSSLRLVDGQDPATGMLESSFTANWGKQTVAFAAPGENVYTSLPSDAGSPGDVARDSSMAAPVAAGVIATLRQVHPEMDSSRILELARKQAGVPANWSRLASPEGEREYRGAGMPSALDAVLKDQARPVVGEVEYSTDGSTWAPLSGQSVSGRVSLRATVTGPVTSARLLVGGQEVATGQGSGEFTGPGVTLQVDGVDVSRPVAGGPAVVGDTSVTVEAFGRNSDSRADDDVVALMPFTVGAGAGTGGSGSGSGASGVAEAGAGRWVTSARGTWWRFDDGTYPTSTRLRIDGKVYRFNARGYVVTGWSRVDGQWSYFGRDGAQAFGWTRIQGAWYYLDPSSGVVHKGWLKDGGHWYYLSSSGAMVTGTHWIDGTRYVFDARGRLLT
nr:S8 family serine peptidase [uncultured Actinomyces sp.]